MQDNVVPIIVWLLVVVVLFFALRSYGVFWWPSLVLALLIGWFFLLFGWNFGCRTKCSCRGRGKGKDSDDSDCDKKDGHKCKRRRDKLTTADAFFAFITLITVVVVIVYVIQKVFRDRCWGGCDHMYHGGSAVAVAVKM